MVGRTIDADERQQPSSRTLPQRILIVRLGAMGDILHALPAVSLLQQAIPEVEIGWVVERRWVPLLSSEKLLAGSTCAERPLVNNVHVVDTRAWRRALLSTETYRELSAAVDQMKLRHYEVALDLQGAIKSAIIARLSGAENIIGFDQPRERAASMLYSTRITTPAAHVVDQNVALAQTLAGEVRGAGAVPLPVDAAAENWVSARLAELGVSRFAILSPTAGWKAKEWAPSNFGLVAIALAERGITSLINFGPGEEQVAAAVRETSQQKAVPFTSEVSQLIALTRRASLFIGGDSGPMHLAAALNVPVVALFGPTDPARNGPYGGRSKVLRNAKSVTSYSHVSQQDEGLARITPDQVIAAVDELLQTGSRT